jgi:hypothetical protein
MALRINVAAYCLRAGNPDDTDHFQKALEVAVRSYLDKVDPHINKRDALLVQSLRTLPLSSLHLLGVVPEVHDVCDIDSLKGDLKEAHESLTNGPEALAPKANVLAHHVLHATTDAKGIASLAEQLFTVKRDDRIFVGTDAMERLTAFLEDLRCNDVATLERVQSALDLSGLIASNAVECSQIENALLHYIFCWPLLVSPQKHVEIPVSVPIAVDARFDDSRRAWERTARRIGPNVYTAGTINIDLDKPNARRRTFASYLAAAARVGRNLWRKTHGHSGDWRQVIETVPIVYDFSYASRIAEGICNDFGLNDGSAGAYFAQVVLARLLGRDAFLSSTVTGLIGPRVHNPSGTVDRDYEFRPVASTSIPRKLEYVFKSRMFERVIIPKVKGATKPVVSAHQTAEVLHAAKLSNVADIVQVLGWRKTHYVRCPDVAWALHRSKGDDGITPRGIIPNDDDEFIRVQSLLAQNESPVVRLINVSPRAVGSYLCYINQAILQGLKRIPPSLSWAFIRVAAEYEQDASFWHVVWRISGASDKDFESFRCSPTTAAALPDLMRVLNKFEPTREAKAHRAPDIIVIIGAERFDEALARLHNPAQRPLAVPPLLEELSKPGRLNPSPFSRPGSGYPVFRQWVGNTRIILLNDDSSSHRKPSTRLRLSKELLCALHRLSTFKSSFSQTTAALVLGDLTIDGEPIRGITVRRVLRRLVKRGALKDVFGEYFLPSRVKEAIEARMSAETTEQRASRHFAVGTALAPYWTVADFPSLAFDAAFVPERVHEAHYHLDEAGRLYDIQGNEPKKDAARKAQRQVMRFGRIGGWAVAQGLIKGRDQMACKQAYLFAEEFMERWRNHPENRSGVPNHPTHLANAAKALRYVDLRTPEIPIFAERFWGGVPDKAAAMIRLFEQALVNCDAFPNEATYNRLMVLSEFSDTLAHLVSRRLASPEALKSIDEKIWKMQSDWTVCPQAIRGAWFERQGDACPDARTAARIYSDGARWARSWHQLKVKGVGALLLAHLDDPLIDDVRSLPRREGEDAALTVLVGVKKAKKNDCDPRGEDWRIFSKRKEHIFRRWDSGLNFLRDAWGRYPPLRDMLDDIK